MNFLRVSVCVLLLFWGNEVENLDVELSGVLANESG